MIGANNLREASLNLDNLTPGTGYTLTLKLYRVGVVVAEGTDTSIALGAGANTANIVLTLTANGSFTVNIQEPVTVAAPTTSLPIAIASESHLSVVRFAGSDAAGNATGSGFYDAAYGKIAGLARYANGDLLLADASNHVLRRVTSTGSAIVAGTGAATGTWATEAGDGGDATSATLNAPRGVVLAGDGTVLVCDSANNRTNNRQWVSPGYYGNIQVVSDIATGSASVNDAGYGIRLWRPVRGHERCGGRRHGRGHPLRGFVGGLWPGDSLRLFQRPCHRRRVGHRRPRRHPDHHGQRLLDHTGRQRGDIGARRRPPAIAC